MGNLDDAPKIDFGIKLKSTGLNRLVKFLFEKFPNKPPQTTYRQRLRDCLRIVLINLVNTAGYISYSRNDHTPQYQPKKYSTRNIRKVVDFLESARFIENMPGFYFADDPTLSRWSRMRPQNKLKELFARYEVNQSDIEIDKKKDLIILRDDERNSIPYPVTPFILSARENLITINESLAAHHIVDSSGFYIHHKIFHRVFNRDFEHGGRFYGGRWQNLSGNDRLNLTIDNITVFEYDYDALHPSMLYAKEGVNLKGDPYSLKGYSPEVRYFLKIVMLVLINTGDKAMAKRAIQKLINFKELIMPNEIKNLDDILNKFMDKHWLIAHLFRSSIGLELQRLDSDICESVLMHFCQKDIPVLSVHDSFIVQKDHEKMLYEVMEEEFYDKFNAVCHVSKKSEKCHVSKHSKKNSILYDSLSSKGLQRFLPEIYC